MIDVPVCNKLGFPSHRKAKQMLKVCKKAARTVPERREANIYICPHCGEWHLTKHPRK